jgi:HSP20 family protein
MANLIKKDGGQAYELSPFRAMRDLLAWDPFREMMPVFGGWNPSFDVTETKDGYVFKADIPGVKKEDIEISTVGNRLQITGKRDVEKETKDDKVYTYEREYGDFMRTFTLPDGVDIEHAKSDLKDGVLTLVIPKLAVAEAKKIPVSTEAKS